MQNCLSLIRSAVNETPICAAILFNMIRSSGEMTLSPKIRTLFPLLFPVFLRKTPMRHETDALTFRYLICFPSDIIFL